MIKMREGLPQWKVQRNEEKRKKENHGGTIQKDQYIKYESQKEYEKEVKEIEKAEEKIPEQMKVTNH